MLRSPSTWLISSCESAAVARRLSALFWVGLLVRLLLMPFSVHGDLLTEVYVAHVRAFDGRFPLEVMGGIFVFSLTHWFHVAWLWLIGGLLPPAHELFHHPWGPAGDPGMTTATDWFAFVQHPHIFRVLFLFKLPYLLLDLVALVLLQRIARSDDQRRRVLVLWWLNPISIFSMYIFGRYEVISVLALVAMLLALRRGRTNRSMLWLGLGAILKMYPFLIAPATVVSCGRRFRRWLGLSLLVFAPGLILLALAHALGLGRELGTFSKFQHNDYLFEMVIAMGPGSGASPAWRLMLFPLGLCAIALHAAARSPGGGPGPTVDETFDVVIRYGLALFAWLYATAFFHPHYAVWSLPFWVVASFYDRRVTALFWVFVPLWVLHTLHWGEALWARLWAPLHPALAWSLTAPYEWLEPATGVVFSALRGGLSSCLVLLVLLLLPPLAGQPSARRR